MGTVGQFVLDKYTLWLVWRSIDKEMSPTSQFSHQASLYTCKIPTLKTLRHIKSTSVP